MSPRSTILLVEDSENDRLIAMRALRGVGTIDSIEVARDGQQALEMLALDEKGSAPSVRPAVIFLDLKMPRVDGFEVLREIRSAEHTREIPVVVLSASARDEDVRESYRLGANSFLVKQFGSANAGEYLAEAARYWTELNRPPTGPRRSTP